MNLDQSVRASAGLIAYAAHRRELLRLGYPDPGPWRDLSPTLRRIWQSEAQRGTRAGER